MKLKHLSNLFMANYTFYQMTLSNLQFDFEQSSIWCWAILNLILSNPQFDVEQSSIWFWAVLNLILSNPQFDFEQSSIWFWAILNLILSNPQFDFEQSSIWFWAILNLILSNSQFDFEQSSICLRQIEGIGTNCTSMKQFSFYCNKLHCIRSDIVQTVMKFVSVKYSMFQMQHESFKQIEYCSNSFVKSALCALFYL